jgi:predicted MFS family arabinose efflux permease
MNSRSTPAAGLSRGQATLVLVALLVVATWNYLDRAIIGILQEPIKAEFRLSDFQLGLLGGPAFALLYVFMGLPFARLAERVNRVRMISAVFVLWSLMTALCGFAGSFAFLLLARAGVSVGEAGCSPSSHSLIADHFPPERRPFALAVFTSGLSIGSLLAALAGGAIGQQLGWRATFLVLGATGAIFALAFLFLVPEAPRTTPVEQTPSFMQALRILATKPVIWHVAAGQMVAAMMGYTMAQYMTSFFIRTHGMGLRDATLHVALISGASGAVGTYLGGMLGNRMSARGGLAGAAIVCAFGFLLAGPLFGLGYLAPDPMVATIMLMIATMAQLSYFGPAYAIVHSSVDSRMRATTIAVILLVANLLGYGLGPPLVGAASDHLAAFLGSGSSAAAGICASASWLNAACKSPVAGGLQWALSLLAIGNLWAFYHFYQVSRLHGGRKQQAVISEPPTR